MSVKISKIIRTNRKTIALQIKQDGCLIVRAPFCASGKFIKDLVFKKMFWIQKKKELIDQKNKNIVRKEFVDGEEFLYLGQPYRLRIVERKTPLLDLSAEFFLSKYCLGRAREIFVDWYREKAREKLKERVDFYALMIGKTYRRINITGAKSRWGSCSFKGNLNFSWRLIMAPDWVVDYVVVHEIFHLIEKNHSQRFWRRVAKLYPEYKKPRKWLKNNGHLLVI